MTDVGSQSPETPAPGVLTPRSQENPPGSHTGTSNQAPHGYSPDANTWLHSDDEPAEDTECRTCQAILNLDSYCPYCSPTAWIGPPPQQR